MMMGTSSASTRSRSRRSYYGNGSSSSERRLLQPAATRHDVVSASTTADHLADLDEDDVWSAVSEGAVTDDHHHYGSAPAMHRRPAYAYAGGGLSLAFEAASSPPPARHSAPVSVPDWPAATGPEDHHHAAGGATDLDDVEDLEWVPPHEYLLQQRRRCGGASSVLEGAGRTLKGRDVTRVRDAVWSKTRFFG